MKLLIEIVAAVVLCAVLAVAQKPTPCQMPQQFQVRVNEFNHSVGDVRFYLLINDEVNQRRVQFEEINANRPGQTFYEHIFLYRQNKYYRISLSSHGVPQTCTAQPIPWPYRPFAIPANATFEGVYSQGSPGTGEGFYVTSWAQRDGMGGFWSMSVSQRECVPVFESFGQSISADATLYYNDFVMGISDPNIFNVPSVCQ